MAQKTPIKKAGDSPVGTVEILPRNAIIIRLKLEANKDVLANCLKCSIDELRDSELSLQMFNR